MPTINFCFSGFINGADVETARDADGNKIDVSGMSSAELCSKLRAGELFISLGDYLYETDSQEVELSDFSEPI